MKKTLLALIFIVSCASSGDKHEYKNQHDHNQCVKYGFKEGSFEYKNCLRQLENQRNTALSN